MKLSHQLPKWFCNTLTKIMNHNEYAPEMLTVEECTKRNKWTPTDLILREYYNNGGGSAKGFLGISPNQCIKCYRFIKENQEMFRKLDLYNDTGYNNSGWMLWTNYNIM